MYYCLCAAVVHLQLCRQFTWRHIYTPEAYQQRSSISGSDHQLFTVDGQPPAHVLQCVNGSAGLFEGRLYECRAVLYDVIHAEEGISVSVCIYFYSELQRLRQCRYVWLKLMQCVFVQCAAWWNELPINQCRASIFLNFGCPCCLLPLYLL